MAYPLSTSGSQTWIGLSTVSLVTLPEGFHWPQEHGRTHKRQASCTGQGVSGPSQQRAGGSSGWTPHFLAPQMGQHRGVFYSLLELEMPNILSCTLILSTLSSLSHFLFPLLAVPGINSQINDLHSDLYFRVCLGGTQTKKKKKKASFAYDHSFF